MIVEVFALAVALSGAPRRIEIGEHEICVNSDDNCNLYSTVGVSHSEPTVLWSADLEAAIAQDLSLVSEINLVLAEHADGNLLVWIVADNPSREVRDKIFDKQLSLIDGFPEVDFDFNVVSSPICEAHDVASNAKLIYSRG